MQDRQQTRRCNMATPEPRPPFSRKPLVLLWLAWGVLAVAVGAQGFLLYRHLEEGGQPPPATLGQDARPPFSKEALEAARNAQIPWLEQFFLENQVPTETASQVRGVLVQYMKHVNMIAVMESEGVHESQDAAQFRSVEYERLDKALKTALGENLAAKMRGPLAENGVLPR